MFHMLEKVNTLELTPEQLPQFDVERILTNVNDPQEYARVIGSI